MVDRILLAAAELGEGGAFTAEELIVKAWQKYPDHFGLQGFADRYPDSNRVLSKIMGKGSALRCRGLLRKVGQKRYLVTDAGQIAAQALGEVGEASGQRLAELTRPLASALHRMLKSPALEKFRRSQPLSFSDVSSFWNISPRSSAFQLADRTQEARSAIQIALKRAATSGTVALPGGVTVSDADLRLLVELGDHIREEFASELDVIRLRHDERRR